VAAVDGADSVLKPRANIALRVLEYETNRRIVCLRRWRLPFHHPNLLGARAALPDAGQRKSNSREAIGITKGRGGNYVGRTPYQQEEFGSRSKVSRAALMPLHAECAVEQ